MRSKKGDKFKTHKKSAVDEALKEVYKSGDGKTGKSPRHKNKDRERRNEARKKNDSLN